MLPLCCIWCQTPVVQCVDHAGKAPVEVKLRFSNDKIGSWLTVDVKNISKDKILIERELEGASPLRQEFYFKCDAGDVEYVGPLAEKTPYSKKGFVELLPGQTIHRHRRVDLDYSFKSGVHTYSVYYTFLVYDDVMKTARGCSAGPYHFEYGGPN